MPPSYFKHWVDLQKKKRGKLVGNPNLSFGANHRITERFGLEIFTTLYSFCVTGGKPCLFFRRSVSAHSFGCVMIASKQLMGLSFWLTLRVWQLNRRERLLWIWEGKRCAVTGSQSRASIGGFPEDLQLVVTLEAVNFGRFMSEKWGSSSWHQGKAWFTGWKMSCPND